MDDHAADICSLKEKIGRLEEKLIASDKALDLAKLALDSWQTNSNKWQEILKEERKSFITYDKLIAILGIIIAAATCIVKFKGKGI